MIVEFPSPACTADATLRKARADFLKLVPHRPLPRYSKLVKPIPVHLVGVPFFDKLHGQTGVAPNGVELHPVLSITKGAQK